MAKYEVKKTFADKDGNMIYAKRDQKVFIEMKSDEAKEFIDCGAIVATEKPKKSKD